MQARDLRGPLGSPARRRAGPQPVIQEHLAAAAAAAEEASQLHLFQRWRSPNNASAAAAAALFLSKAAGLLSALGILEVWIKKTSLRRCMQSSSALETACLRIRRQAESKDAAPLAFMSPTGIKERVVMETTFYSKQGCIFIFLLLTAWNFSHELATFILRFFVFLFWRNYERNNPWIFRHHFD